MPNVKNEDYTIFYKKFVGYAHEMVNELKNDYLSKLGLDVWFDKNYNFNGKKWFASYEHEKNMINDGTIIIALNVPYLYKCMKRKGIDKSDFNIEAQARITIGHEIGHGLIDYILNVYDGDSKLADGLIHDFYDGELDEEKLVEEFGESLFPEATGVWGSDLYSIISDIIS